MRHRAWAGASSISSIFLHMLLFCILRAWNNCLDKPTFARTQPVLAWQISVMSYIYKPDGRRLQVKMGFTQAMFMYEKKEGHPPRRVKLTPLPEPTFVPTCSSCLKQCFHDSTLLSWPGWVSQSVYMDNSWSGYWGRWPGKAGHPSCLANFLFLM